MTNSNQPERRRGPDSKKSAASSQGDFPRPTTSRRGEKAKAEGAVSPTVARQIDENLKRLYDKHVQQELPPQLQALVARLRGGEAPAEPDSGTDPEGSA